jgi:hypothetical protein
MDQEGKRILTSIKLQISGILPFGWIIKANLYLSDDNFGEGSKIMNPNDYPTNY